MNATEYYPWVEEEHTVQEEEIPEAEHECEADAVFAIMEQLYDSGNAIDKEALRRHFSYLCGKMGLPKEYLRDPNGLCVIHHSEKTKGWEADALSAIKQHTKVMKEELCAEHRPVDQDRLSSAVSSICWLVGDTFPYGETIKVCRSNGWRHHQ